MKLYLQHDIDTDERFLSETDTIGSGSIFSSIEGTTTDYTLNFKPEHVLRDSMAKIHLFFSVTGSVAITPVAIISVPEFIEGQEEPIYENVFLSPNDIETKNTLVGDIGVTFDWDFQINNNYPLEDSHIILRLFIEDTRADPGNASSITLDESYFEAEIVSGEKQTIEAFTTAIFKVYQRTERIFAFTTVDAKESIEIPIFSNVNNKEQVFMDVYTRVDAKEDVRFNIGTNIHPHGPFTDDEPHVTEIEIGNYILPTWDLPISEQFYLRKRENLYNLVDELETDYKIIVPPDPTVVKFTETSLSNTANKMIEVFEMLKLQNDRTVPGEVFKVFIPGALSGGTVEFRDKEWQLPIGFNTQEYWVPFSISPTNTMRPVESGNSLWFCLRHRMVGASVNAYYRERAGNLVLRKRINSREEVRVWMWDSASTPFNVTLFVSNRVLQRPGFAGNSTGLMLG